MSLDNKETLLKANACVSKGDNEGFLSFCTEDIRYEFVGDTVLQGKESVRAYMKKAYTAPPEFDVENLIADADFVTAIGKISMNDESGKRIDYSYCDVWRFQDGKMADLKAFVIAITSK
ncbi:Ketosteroid isomerase-related protein [Chitinophaga sp. YR627]|uniref:nuclear transport factor 2 family protein n=1 Tax=Chitinophaga sp. YR627 TaxID=1881041 RepID=UPI0008EA42B5|nr:nuclear transport factor 2 family protein [Chitinophaga sp. YR627]SFM88611.1 Ketosteroid isomerase-related protein [Chitinophaga sp. YR627]